MSLNITIRGLEGGGHSDALRNYINDNFAKVNDFLSAEKWSPVDVDIVLSILKPHVHEFEIRIRGPHFNVIVKKEGDDVYKLINHVIDVVLEDLRRYKRKMVDKRNEGGFNRPG